MEFLGYITCIGIFVGLMLAIYGMYLKISRKFDHHKWDLDSHPSLDAKIIDIKSKKIDNGRRNYADFETTIKFSDGFNYITYKSKIEVIPTGIFEHYYRIGVTPEILKSKIEKAKIVHDEKVRKRNGLEADKK